ncbi:MAG: imidazole glycerol phosphate synthase subunit HisH, partial [Spirochaetota bacterium]|nr:imidazole glycerol phosphate synthase subunit HisH [Spirochaetota bacterium]
MILIIDYGRGNLNNVKKAFESFHFDARIIEKPDGIPDATGLVLPGVGAFGDSMSALNEMGFSDKIREFAESGKPLLGICLGLQLLFESSEEFGHQEGLGILKGHVKRFDIEEKVPHIGWNQAEYRKESRLFEGIPDRSYFYFVHSYYACPEEESVKAASTMYGLDFCSAVEYENIYATQFHPEKS